MFDLFRGAVLGLIQGLTEFFPVSSSGHLILVPAVFGWPDQGLAFDTVLHLGTLAAVVWVFRRELAAMLASLFDRQQKTDRRLLMLVIAASLPGILAGGLFGSAIETVLRNPRSVAFNLAFWGLILFVADRFAAARTRDARHISWFQTIIAGLSQALALMPGTSRSGITMTSGLVTGLDRATAVKFSFLVSIPTIAAAGAYGLYKLMRDGVPAGGGLGLAAGFMAAAISGAWAIRWLTSFVSKHSFVPFVVYRLALALVIVVIL